MSGKLSVQPYTKNCRRIFECADHALIGLSPFNSYFTPQTIKNLVTWAAKHFSAVDVFMPGYEGAHTLTAAGITPQKAVNRIRQANKMLRNPAISALASCGIPDPECRVHTWTQLLNRSSYRNLRELVRASYTTEPVIRHAHRQISQAVVQRVSKTTPTEQQIDEAVGYSIAELPLFLDSPSIFGVSSSVFIYHRSFEIIKFLVNNSSILKVASDQGFTVVMPAEAGEEERTFFSGNDAGMSTHQRSHYTIEGAVQ